MPLWSSITVLIMLCVFWSGGGLAQTPPAAKESPPPAPPSGQVVEEVKVIGVSPLMGTGIDASKMPTTTRVLSSKDLSRTTGTPSLVDGLDNQIGSVNMNQVQGNPYQPDFNFRGFTASPVEGTPAGLAVYMNGARVNEAFGDTVNWDLIPAVAINSLNLTSANPVYGFNALGGAVAIEMKNGFTYQGGLSGNVSGGSYGRRGALTEYGAKSGYWGGYLGANWSDEDGWRTNMPSRVRQLHSDLGYEDNRSMLHLSFTGADNRLGGTGPTPINLLAQDYASAIDYPGRIRNTLAMLTLNGSTNLTETLSVQGNFFYRAYKQDLLNGAPTSATPCTANPSTFCSTDPVTMVGKPLVDQFGRSVPVSIGGQFPGESDHLETSTNTLGWTLQTTSTAKLVDHENHFVLGGSVIRADTNFKVTPLLGPIDETRTVIGSLPVTSDGPIRQVSLNATTTYSGLYVTDTFDLTPSLSLTAGGRYNLAEVKLNDQLRNDLTGTHRYYRFNPSAGLTYKITPQINAFAGYAENNRVPTPAELSCASPEQACTLANFFISDPELKQVVAKTKEAGLRGQLTTGQAGRVQWSLTAFRTDNSNDILAVASSIPLRGFFQNAGQTRRQGIEVSTVYRDPRWRLAADYTLLDATFQSNLVLSSPFNPAADANGNIFVHPGNALPGIPMHRVKLNADYAVIPSWTVGATLLINSSQVLRGDESNQTSRVPGYYVLKLRTTYSFNEHWQLWANIDNVTYHRYYTFGTWTTESGLPMPAGLTALQSVRAYGPGAPIGGWVGLRFLF